MNDRMRNWAESTSARLHTESADIRTPFGRARHRLRSLFAALPIVTRRAKTKGLVRASEESELPLGRAKPSNHR